jgi:Holliday junction resolvase RusA-like endonuclease
MPIVTREGGITTDLNYSMTSTKFFYSVSTVTRKLNITKMPKNGSLTNCVLVINLKKRREMKQQLELSIPPSVNNLYGRNRMGFTYISHQGKIWFEESQYRAKAQLDSWVTSTNDVRVTIEMFTCIRRDVDNIGKASLDLIAKYLQLIENDNQVVELKISKQKVAHKADEKLLILIETVH